ncbi:MAG: mannose-1-phosphate guanylyltransferase/mannose-6-phosphate isomerase [Chromatiales bacterium]|jgi:mannose-1-phosphate guanylyltransferase/mannose-6-phosphate isomerase|nr:mannose-1-phosphate guanylyltransferase/mannose-6-phosphate isomerase [Chromatiales bacterium]MDX9765803.1 mannose-1-phosphate guanylyltransferase/mannose-6-phosphate isomerase [Ectothiorhodospiraceae bacterium]
MSGQAADIVPVILSGGSGTRLWPLSRKLFPKQFHALADEWSLLQGTLRRLGGLPDLARPIVVANVEHRFLVAEQLREIEVEADLLLEPIGRNTAPAAAVAALHARRDGNDPVLLVLPADHVIPDHAALHAAIRTAVRHAREGQLVTFGIVPTRPETGYGYLHRGASIDADGGAFRLASFVEKPDAARAQSFIDSGEYFWNSGMFAFRAGAWLDALGTHAPAIREAAEAALRDARRDLDFLRLDGEAFARCPSDSIDYAVMEHLSDGVIVALDAGWNDVGSWDALAGDQHADAQGNVLRGDVRMLDCENSFVHATSRLVAAVGLDDVLLVETPDAVLVADRAHAQQVKEIVALLEREGRPETSLHRLVHRPWGSYDCITHGDRYQVKRIVVKPGASLSLQLHHHRAEHWIVVRGTARVLRGEEEILLGENESTYIPLGVQHRLENPGRIDLEIIEVQSGAYLGEDDIVRLEDRYGRKV